MLVFGLIAKTYIIIFEASCTDNPHYKPYSQQNNSKDKELAAQYHNTAKSSIAYTNTGHL